jgi:hypothetical protein
VYDPAADFAQIHQADDRPRRGPAAIVAGVVLVDAAVEPSACDPAAGLPINQADEPPTMRHSLPSRRVGPDCKRRSWCKIWAASSTSVQQSRGEIMSVGIEFSGDSSKFVAALEKSAAAMETVVRGLGTIAQQSKQVQRDVDAMGTEAVRALRATESPLDRIGKGMTDLARAFQDGKIDAQEYEKATNFLTDKLDQALAKDRAEAGKLTENLQKAGDATKEAFGGKAMDMLKQFGQGITGISGPMDLLRQALASIGEMQQGAARRARESEFGYGSLAEISEGSPEKYRQNVAQARTIAATAGMNENRATRLVFALSSAGAMEEADVFADAYKMGVVQDPENLLVSATATRKAMGKSAGSNKDLLSAAFAAGEFSPSKAAELLAASAGAAAYAEPAGVDVRNLLAGTAINAAVLDPTGGAERGGTAMRSLLKSLGRMRSIGQGTAGDAEIDSDEEGKILTSDAKAIRARIAKKLAAVKGGDLVNQLEAIQSENLPEADLQRLFGRQEGLIAYRNILKNPQDFRHAVERQGEGVRDDLFHRILALPDADESTSSARHARIEEKNLEIALTPEGVLPNQLWALQSHEMARITKGTLPTWLPKRFQAVETAPRWLEQHTDWVNPLRDRALAIGQLLGAGVADDDPKLERDSIRAAGEEALLNIPDAQMGIRRAVNRNRQRQGQRPLKGWENEDANLRPAGDPLRQMVQSGQVADFKAAVDRLGAAADKLGQLSEAAPQLKAAAEKLDTQSRARPAMSSPDRDR